MPDKLMRLRRSESAPDAPRPVMLAIAGDSAAGKTTLTRGIAAALGADRAHRTVRGRLPPATNRAERRSVPFTVLNPDCNYMSVMEQHLQLLALGRPILKPVYDHATGQLGPGRFLVEPREFVIVEGLLPLHTRLSRACFDIAVLPGPARRHPAGVENSSGTAPSAATPVSRLLAELERREPESAAYIRPQRQQADISIRVRPGRRASGARRDPAVRGDPAPADHPAPRNCPMCSPTMTGGPLHLKLIGTATAARWTRCTCTVTRRGRTAGSWRRRSGSSCRSSPTRPPRTSWGSTAPGQRSESPGHRPAPAALAPARGADVTAKWVPFRAWIS